MSGKTITIKINGDHRSFLQEPEDLSGETINKNDQFPVSAAPLSESNFIEPTGSKEIAATQEMMEENFDWILPEQSENETSEYTLKTSTKPKKGKVKDTSFSSMKKNHFPFKPIVLSIFFAILIGASFGFIMLKLVVTNHGKEVPVALNGMNNPSQNGKENTSSISTTIPSWSPFVVQGGIYSSKDAALTVANSIIKNGVPCEVTEISGKSFLFIGVSNSIETAKSLANYYKNNGVGDVYGKSLTVPEKHVSSINQEEKNFLDLAPSVYQMLSEVTSAAIVNGSIPKESLNSISTIKDKINSIKMKNNKMKDLSSELRTAMDQIMAYQKSSSKKELIKAQQHLLTYLSIYQSI